MRNDSKEKTLISPSVEMSTGGTEEITHLLLDLNRHCLDIQLSMVSTRDGLTISSCGTVLDPDQVGAMCSELITVCHKAACQLEQGELDQMILRCSNGCLFLMPAGEHAVLAIMAVPEVNLGMLLLEAQRAARLIQAAL